MHLCAGDRVQPRADCGLFERFKSPISIERCIRREIKDRGDHSKRSHSKQSHQVNSLKHQTGSRGHQLLRKNVKFTFLLVLHIVGEKQEYSSPSSLAVTGLGAPLNNSVLKRRYISLQNE